MTQGPTLPSRQCSPVVRPASPQGAFQARRTVRLGSRRAAPRPFFPAPPSHRGISRYPLPIRPFASILRLPNKTQ